jgi:hypothetical protein
MHKCPQDPVKIARGILDYLSRQPAAEDTLEGIMQYWMPERSTGQQMTMVKEALGDLVTQGLLEKTTKEGRTVYRVKPGH